MSEFTSFVERPEKVHAFQFNGPLDVEAVLDAFEASHDKWTLHKEGKRKYRLTFPRGKATTPQATSTPGLVFDGTISIVNGQQYYTAPSNDYAIVTGSWVVRRYIDTDHPEVTVLSDKEFRRKYRAQIEAA